jgi:predicted transcriptional regulator
MKRDLSLFLSPEGEYLRMNKGNRRAAMISEKAMKTFVEQHKDRLNTLRQLYAALESESLSNSQEESLKRRVRVVRRELSWKLTTESGLTQSTIAALLNCSQPTISRDLKSFTDDILDDLRDTVEQEKLTQIHQLKGMIEELYGSWIESKGMEKVVTRAKSEDEESEGEDEKEKGGGKSRIRTTVKGREGNRGYLRDARSCMSDIRKILGADAPLKVAATTPDGEEASPIMIYIPDNRRPPQKSEEEDEQSK